MDWGKAKSILITVFIILNIFLLVNLSLNKLSKTSSKEAISNTVTILENKGISLEGGIPDIDGSVGRLSILSEADFDIAQVAEKLLGEKVEFPKEMKEGLSLTASNGVFTILNYYSFEYKNGRLKTDIDTSNERSVEKYVRNLLQDVGIKESEFQTDSYEKLKGGSIKLVLIHRYKDVLIFNNTITAIISDEGLNELKCSIRKPGTLSSKADVIYPAYKMLLTNFGDFSDMVITSIHMGYNIDKIDSGKPVWRVKIEDQEKWFDATTGIEL